MANTHKMNVVVKAYAWPNSKCNLPPTFLEELSFARLVASFGFTETLRSKMKLANREFILQALDDTNYGIWCKAAYVLWSVTYSWEASSIFEMAYCRGT